jgi:flagellar motor protein MotB
LLFAASQWLNRTDSTGQDDSIPTATPYVTPLPTETPNPIPVVRSEVADLKTKISEVSGVETEIKEPSNALDVTFDEGIFTHGTVLKPNAHKKLKEVGFQLKPYTDTIRVEIIGVTDDLSMRLDSLYKDNAALGMERARVVYDYLHKSVGLEAQIFTIASYSEPQSPYPNDTPSNRSRNRTVILRINERQK